MSKTILVTQPNFDLTTNYISHWAEKIVENAKKKNIKTVCLKGKRATRREFESVNKKIQPQVIFFNGHGNYNVVAGQDNEILVKAGENDKCLKNTIVYALSCRSAKKLGVSSVKNGAKAYIGYSEDFMFNYDPEKITKPLEDKIAKLFLEPSNSILNSLLKGHTAQESFENSQQNFKKKITEVFLKGDKIEINTYVSNLLWDMQNQIVWGDKNAVI